MRRKSARMILLFQLTTIANSVNSFRDCRPSRRFDPQQVGIKMFYFQWKLSVHFAQVIFQDFAVFHDQRDIVNIFQRTDIL